MNRRYSTSLLLLLVLVLIAVVAYIGLHRTHTQTPTAVATSSYLCRDGKSMDAIFSDTNVTLTLSDTRSFVLPQVVSASGIRYEKAGVVFVGKGNNAYLEEAGKQTFIDCVVTAKPSLPGSVSTFNDQGNTFSFTYPSSVTVSGGGIGYTTSWMNNATTSGLILAKATLPKSFQPNTNFSEGTLTVGTSADPSAVKTCLTYNPTGGPATATSSAQIQGSTYAVLHSSDAGAGNQYETTSYRIVRFNQCYAIEYTIHSTNIGNYSPDQGIKAYDQTQVKNVFESIVQSFQFNGQS